MNDHQAIFESGILINAFECDFLGRWKPAAYFQHLSETAGRHAEQLGVGFEMMVAQNLFWVHSRMKIKFFGSPMAGDTITIRTWPKTIQQKLFYIRDFEVLDANGDLLAAASSAWLVINASTRRIVTPQTINLDLPALNDRNALDEPLDRLGLSQTGEEKLRVTASYSSVDPLGHVNNSRYVDWICDVFPMDDYRKHSLDWMQVNYDREIRPSEEVALLAKRSGEDPELWMVEGVNRTNNQRSFEAALHWR